MSAATGNLKLAQKLLGHTQLATTADVYTHVLPEQDARAVEAPVRAVSRILFPIVPKTARIRFWEQTAKVEVSNEVDPARQRKRATFR